MCMWPKAVYVLSPLTKQTRFRDVSAIVDGILGQSRFPSATFGRRCHAAGCKKRKRELSNYGVKSAAEGKCAPLTWVLGLRRVPLRRVFRLLGLNIKTKRNLANDHQNLTPCNSLALPACQVYPLLIVADLVQFPGQDLSPTIHPKWLPQIIMANFWLIYQHGFLRAFRKPLG